ncbi:hypothetical protein ACJMK2_030803 [Sinanodonta woodiana]|uniref:B box-type domain-containing protein n=1 Tax=Sinanodonta woodiana TaxID=1069815 RepID=A0ABD3WWV5_SINWO
MDGVLCETCTENNPALRKCVQCRQMLCQNCSDIHQKMRISSNHNMESLSQQDVRFQRANKVQFCLKHPKESLVFLCRQCNLPLCLHCKLSTHEGHVTEGLKDAADPIREHLSKLIQKCKSYLPYLTKRITIITAADKENEVQEQQVVHRIKDQIEAIKQELDKVFDNLKVQLQHEQGKKDRERDMLRTNIAQFASDVFSVENWLDQSFHWDLIKDGNSIQTRVQTMLDNSPTSIFKKTSVKFQVGQINRDLLKKMVGFLNVTETGVHEISVTRLLTLNVGTDMLVRCLCVTKEKKIMLSKLWHKGVFVYDQESNLQDEMVRHSQDIDSITVDDDGNAFISIRHEKKVIKIDRTKQLSVLPLGLYPRGLAILADGSLAICAVQTATYRTYQKNHCNMIMICNNDGTRKGDILTINNMPLAYPHRIALNGLNDNIVIGDRLLGSFFILGRYGNYISKTKLTSYPKLTYSVITDIACDKFGHIFVADGNVHDIHMFDSKGAFLYTVVGRDILCDQVCSIASDGNTLWVGSVGMVHRYRYLKCFEN